MAAGKVEIGAFRVYPKGYKPPDEGPSEYQSIPLNKIEDFGVHCKGEGVTIGFQSWAKLTTNHNKLITAWRYLASNRH